MIMRERCDMSERPRFEVRRMQDHRLEHVFGSTWFASACGYAEECVREGDGAMIIVDLDLLPEDHDRGIVWRSE